MRAQMQWNNTWYLMLQNMFQIGYYDWRFRHIFWYNARYHLMFPLWNGRNISNIQIIINYKFAYSTVSVMCMCVYDFERIFGVKWCSHWNECARVNPIHFFVFLLTNINGSSLFLILLFRIISKTEWERCSQCAMSAMSAINAECWTRNHHIK